MQESNSKQTEYACPYRDQCTFVQSNEARMPELVQRIGRRFCTVEKAQCARRELYGLVHPRHIPPLMLPGQYEWARQIVEEIEKDTDVTEQTTTSVHSKK